MKRKTRVGYPPLPTSSFCHSDNVNFLYTIKLYEEGQLKMAQRISKFDNVGYEPVLYEEELSLSNPSPEALHQPYRALCTSIRYIVYAIIACFLILTGVLIGSHRNLSAQHDSSLSICK